MISANALVHTAIGAAFAGLFMTGGTAMAGDDKAVLRDSAERAPRPADVVMSLVVTRQGKIVVVDRDGRPVQPCHLPTGKKDRPTDAKGAATEGPLCEGTSDTSILEVTPISIVRHTGSTCHTAIMVIDGTLRKMTICTP